MHSDYKKAAENLLKESIELSLRPKKGDRVEVLIHAFDFIFREYAEEIPGNNHIVNSQHISYLIRELRELERDAGRN